MKKKAFLVSLIFCVMLISSCTDTSKEYQERIESEIQLINKNDTVNAGGSGQGQDDSNDED